MRSNFLSLVFCALLSGCATGYMQEFEVTSSDGVRIEVNEIELCQSTPCHILLRCTGWGDIYTVSAVPLPGSGQNVQAKVISSCGIGRDPASIHFEMGLRPIETLEVR